LAEPAAAGVRANRSESQAGIAGNKEPDGACEQRVAPLRPLDFAQRPLFAPLADLLRATSELPDCAALNRWAEQCTRGESTSRSPVRFVVPDALPLRYEERIDLRREVVTRPDSWHDFFNALVWLRFPQTKAALNAAHLRSMGRHGAAAGRGPVRDALTQFDESGIVVVSSDSTLLDLLMGRCWKTLFWNRRLEVAQHMRFLVFGHGLYDALRAPFYRICGRAALLTVDPAMIARDWVSLCVAIDPILAARFANDCYPRPRALLALPLLGIPGVTTDSESPEYYDDQEQFRPPPAWR